MAAAKGKQRLAVLVQVKISQRASRLLHKRAQRSLRTQASYLRALIYQHLKLADVDGLIVDLDPSRRGKDANNAR